MIYNKCARKSDSCSLTESFSRHPFHIIQYNEFWQTNEDASKLISCAFRKSILLKQVWEYILNLYYVTHSGPISHRITSRLSVTSIFWRRTIDRTRAFGKMVYTSIIHLYLTIIITICNTKCVIYKVTNFKRVLVAGDEHRFSCDFRILGLGKVARKLVAGRRK